MSCACAGAVSSTANDMLTEKQMDARSEYGLRMMKCLR